MSFVKAFTDFSCELAKNYMRPPSKIIVDDRTYREIRDQICGLSSYRAIGFDGGLSIQTMLGKTEIINEHADRGEAPAK